MCNFYVMDGGDCYRGVLPYEQKAIGGDTDLCHKQGFDEFGKLIASSILTLEQVFQSARLFPENRWRTLYRQVSVPTDSSINYIAVSD